MLCLLARLFTAGFANNCHKSASPCSAFRGGLLQDVGGHRTGSYEAANQLQFALAHKRYGRVFVRIVSGVCKPNTAYSLER